MPKECKCCGAMKYTAPENGFVKCVYCKTKYSLAEIEDTPVTEELNTIELVEKFSKSVCEITTSSVLNNQTITTSATGWYIGGKTILTNAHVALADYYVFNSKACDEIFCVFPYVNVNKKYKLFVEKVDQINDIAVLSLEDDFDLRPYAIVLAKDDNLRLGQTVYTIGNSIGKGIVPQKGMISKLDEKNNYIDYKQNVIESATTIRTTLIIRHGNSGGPLLNSKGEAVGIMSASYCNPNDKVKIINKAQERILEDLEINLTEEYAELSIARNLECIKKLLASKDRYNGLEIRSIPTDDSAKLLKTILMDLQHNVFPSSILNDLHSFIEILESGSEGLLDFISFIAKKNNLNIELPKDSIQIEKLNLKNKTIYLLYFPYFEEFGSCYYCIFFKEDEKYFTVEYPNILTMYNGTKRMNLGEVNPEDLEKILLDLFNLLQQL